MVAALAAFSTAANAATPAVTIGGTPVTSVPAAKYYNFQPWANDSQRKTLKFSITNKPAWAGFDAAYGRLYGSPVPANVGTYRNVIISVSDGQAQATLPAFSITVQPLADPGPAISGTPPTATAVGASYSFQPTTSNPYGLRIVFQASNKPAWLTLDTATGKLSGTPGAGDVGTYRQIVESVSDGYKSATLKAFDLTVSAATAGQPVSPPSTPPSTPPAAPQPASASVTLQWEPPTDNTDASPLTDMAGYHIYYGTNAQFLSSNVTVANPGIARYVVDNLAPGTWYFSVAAFNSSGLEGDRSDLATRAVQ